MRERVAPFEVVIVPPLVHYIHYTFSSNPRVMQRFTAVETARVVYRAGPMRNRRFTLTEFFMTKNRPYVRKNSQ